MIGSLRIQPFSMVDTYLEECLKHGLAVRWPDAAMPIKLYIAPFQWYEQSKQQNAGLYHQMVLNAMQLWSEASDKAIRFQVVPDMMSSQINVAWKRVERKRLGFCQYHINDKSMLFSAEVNIGLSDGKVHARYNDPREVQETITHEMGHALGLIGHSERDEDLMYPNRQYGQYEGLSERDTTSIQWLYRLPVGFDYMTTGKQYELKSPFTLNQVLHEIAGGSSSESAFKKKLKQRQVKEQPEVLEKQHDILTQQGKFWLSTQNIQVPLDTQQFLASQHPSQKGKKHPPTPPHP